MSSEQQHWYEQITPLESNKIGSSKDIAEKLDLADTFIEKDVEKFNKRSTKESKGDEKWMKDLAGKGTLSDKIAALTVLVQMNPLCTIENLRILIAMTKKKGNRESQLSADALKDLFIHDLLPNRKLKYFDNQPILDPAMTTKHLKYWRYEHYLKLNYLEFCQSLEKLAANSLPQFRRHAMTIIEDLLAHKPEQDQFLLSILVNKLGDPDGKTASKASYLLTYLLKSHREMRSTVFKEIAQMISRNTDSLISDKKPKKDFKKNKNNNNNNNNDNDNNGVYYGLTTLNQFLLSQDTSKLAEDMVLFYISLFKGNDSLRNKYLSAILTGINRALPYTGTNFVRNLENQLDSLFKVIHKSGFKPSLQALSLVYEIGIVNEGIMDRFYRALYSKLYEDDIRTASKVSFFFKILYKAIKNDTQIYRQYSFIKRLLQVCLHMNPPFICCSLFLVSEVIRSQPYLQYSITQSDSLKSVPTIEEPPDIRSDKYDAYNRNPLYCCSHLTCFWELIPLSQHYHPSVRLFASTLLKADENQRIHVKNDPLNTYSFSQFLDKFVYKKPKPKDIEHVKGKQQQLNKYESIPLNSPQFWTRKEEKIAPDDMFFYKYFKARSELVKPVKKQKMSEDDFFDRVVEKQMINDPKVDIDDDDDINDFHMSDDDEGNEDFNDEGMNDDFEDEIDEDQIKEMDGFDANELLEEEGEDDDLDDLDEDEQPSGLKKGKKSTSVFASADDFQELLDNSGKKEEKGKMKKWIQKQDNLHEDYEPRNKGRGRKRPHGSIKHKGNKKRKTTK